ncbi:MAG: hypothetical protein KJZ87_09280 [Thermoguttaceae bacterium]|nr:hypothetical protein [Thermoguttaceae bacterium]
MSPRSSTEPTFYRKPRADMYTVLLAIALAALIAGCVLLWLDTSPYAPNYWSGGPSVSIEVVPPGAARVADVALTAPAPPLALCG